MNDEMSDVHNNIMNWLDEGLSNQEMYDRLYGMLGEPFDIRYIEKSGYLYVENSWSITPNNTITMDFLIPKDVSNNIPNPDIKDSFLDEIKLIDFVRFKENEEPEITLEEQLQMAIDNEDYEKAIILRDKINEK